MGKLKNNFPRISIERIGFDENGRIDYIDIHDEKFGTAVFLYKESEHYHGFLNEGEYNERKTETK